MFIQTTRQATILLFVGLCLVNWNIALCQTNASQTGDQVTNNSQLSTPQESPNGSPPTASQNQILVDSNKKNQLLNGLAILKYGIMDREGIFKDNQQPVSMTMGSSKTVNLSMLLDTKLISNASQINLEFLTTSPQFDILFPQYSDSNSDWLKLITGSSDNDTHTWVTCLVTLRANYIGDAIIVPKLIKGIPTDKTGNENVTYVIVREPRLEIPVTVIRDESVWEMIFIISVTVLVVVTYINIGAQLDLDNLKQILRRPKTMLLGFMLTVIVMPALSWFTCKWLIPNQLLYRIGSFVFAITPAASASTLWTVMLEADKELSVSLQVLSTFGSLLSMPISLYVMDLALQNEGSHYMIKVPYMKLIQSITVLLIALIVGWRLLGRSDKLRKISSRIFKPFIFAVLFFIIVFSSTLYWFIYRMFNWTITYNSFLIALSTYVATGAIGYLINFNLDHAITISISSAYKNSGIAFAVLLVAFEAPDYFIAYVPCLTQVVVTSLILYTIYSGRLLYTRLLRRNQPDPIQAVKPEDNLKSDTTPTVSRDPQSENAEEEEEFIDVNVTDVPPSNPKFVPPAESQ